MVNNNPLRMGCLAWVLSVARRLPNTVNRSSAGVRYIASKVTKSMVGLNISHSLVEACTGGRGRDCQRRIAQRKPHCHTYSVHRILGESDLHCPRVHGLAASIRPALIAAITVAGPIGTDEMSTRLCEHVVGRIPMSRGSIVLVRDLVQGGPPAVWVPRLMGINVAASVVGYQGVVRSSCAAVHSRVG
ncbi:hypothetical protein LX36DRAFT_124013 [Colletotrichum falcatum]|nr:hypothetical protein LX36DRAFT_124013 [Colletotrichum falcatum]